MSEKPSIHRVLFPEPAGKPSVAAVLKELHEGRYAPTRTDEGASNREKDNRSKREAYAITAYILEQVHPEIERAFEKDLAETGRFPNTPEDQVYLTQVIHKQRDRYADVARPILAKWVSAMEARPENDASQDVRAYRRLDELLEETRPVAELSAAYGGQVGYFIMRGVNTAAQVSWGVLEAIPLAFERHFDRVITPEEFESIAASAEPLLSMLASMHIDRFSLASEFAGKMADPSSLLREIEFPLEFFHIVEQADGNLGLAFDEIALARFQDFLRAQNEGLGFDAQDSEADSNTIVRLGCPGRDARVMGPDGKPESVIASVYRLHRDMARIYLTPNLNEYTPRLLDS